MLPKEVDALSKRQVSKLWSKALAHVTQEFCPKEHLPDTVYEISERHWQHHLPGLLHNSLDGWRLLGCSHEWRRCQDLEPEAHAECSPRAPYWECASGQKSAIQRLRRDLRHVRRHWRTCPHHAPHRSAVTLQSDTFQIFSRSLNSLNGARAASLWLSSRGRREGFELQAIRGVGAAGRATSTRLTNFGTASAS